MNRERDHCFVGVDLGGTKVHAGLVRDGTVIQREYTLLPAEPAGARGILDLIVETIGTISSGEDIQGIGIGVPSILDKENGIIYEVQNISSWKEIPLGPILEREFGCPVRMNNDANCFALGEYYFGTGKGVDNFVGITLGTGLGAGIITRGKLIGDANCGSGEFGMIPYRDGIVEDYCSGKFFKRFYQADGETLYHRAERGDVRALRAFELFGHHLAHVIKLILHTVDPQRIAIGGSIAASRKHFDTSMREGISDFPYSRVLQRVEIGYAEASNIALLGAASLFYHD